MTSEAVWRDFVYSLSSKKQVLKLETATHTFLGFWHYNQHCINVATQFFTSTEVIVISLVAILTSDSFDLEKCSYGSKI